MTATVAPAKPLSERTDAELIEEGRTLNSTIERSQLRLGRLALAFAPVGERGFNTGVEERLLMYAREIGATVDTLRGYRAVAHAWSVVEDLSESELSFSILRSLMSVGDKDKALAVLRAEEPDGGWTVEGAEEHFRSNGMLRQRKPRDELPRGIADELDDVFEHLGSVGIDGYLSDPDERDEVVARLNKIGRLTTRLRKRATEEPKPDTTSGDE